MEEEPSPQAKAGWARFENVFATRPIQTDKYTITTVFPNFSIDTIRGATFFIACVEPLDPRRSLMHGYLLSTKVAPQFQDSALIKAYNNMFVDFGRAIFAEDKEAVERVQVGVEQVSTTGLLSEEEERIWAFHRIYRTVMGLPEPKVKGE
jgi:phenylpropionate dioxygenase-like ring-hydroxylating dioxygenase large terminal subunit